MKDGDDSRKDNLAFLLKRIRNHYGDLFDILIIEQDRAPTENFREIVPGEYRYDFLYNPEAYNRGWLYNVAVKHFAESEVVAFCATDILPGDNFLDCIISCCSGFDSIWPPRRPVSTDEGRVGKECGSKCC